MTCLSAKQLEVNINRLRITCWASEATRHNLSTLPSRLKTYMKPSKKRISTTIAGNNIFRRVCKTNGKTLSSIPSSKHSEVYIHLFSRYLVRNHTRSNRVHLPLHDSPPTLLYLRQPCLKQSAFHWQQDFGPRSYSMPCAENLRMLLWRNSAEQSWAEDVSSCNQRNPEKDHSMFAFDEQKYLIDWSIKNDAHRLLCPPYVPSKALILPRKRAIVYNSVGNSPVCLGSTGSDRYPFDWSQPFLQDPLQESDKQGGERTEWAYERAG